MANERVNKVVLGNETLIDLTSDTVTANNLLSGATAHDASGERIQGNVSVPTVLDDLSDVNASSPTSGDVLFNDGTEWINKKITIEVTQAEYNALEIAGTVDPDVRYRIKDGILTCAPVDDNDISEQKTWSSAKIGRYSTDEEVVGTWIDGKPIYRRVIEITVTSVNTDINVSSYGIDKVLSLRGCSASYYLPFNIDVNTSVLPYSISLNYENGLIEIRFGNSRSIETPVYVIIEYTKTTD